MDCICTQKIQCISVYRTNNLRSSCICTPKKKNYQKKLAPEVQIPNKVCKNPHESYDHQMIEQHLPVSADFPGTSNFQSNEIGIASS